MKPYIIAAILAFIADLAFATPNAKHRDIPTPQAANDGTYDVVRAARGRKHRRRDAKDPKIKVEVGPAVAANDGTYDVVHAARGRKHGRRDADL